MQANKRIGFTLMELLVVISIMALVALVAIPKLADVLDRSRSGVQTYSLADISRSIETFNAMNRKYPEGFDLLLDAVGGTASAEPTALATYKTASGTSSLLHANLKALLTTTSLSDNQVAALTNAGISHAFSHVSYTDSEGTTLLHLPSDTGRVRHHIGKSGNGHDGTANANKVAIINTAIDAGKYVVLDNLNPIQNTDASADATNIDKFIYVALGVGPRSTLVQNVIQDAPLFDSATPATKYARAIAIFAVPSTATATSKARLVGVIAPDGRGKSDSLSDYNNIAVPH